MRKHTLIVTLALVVAAASGCSSSDSSKVEEAEAVSDTAAKKSAEKEELDHPVRSEDNQFVTFETNFGNMTLELYHDVAPAHADSFAARAGDGFFEGTIFHRVVKNFMIQGGNASAVGRRPVAYTLNAEFNDLPHKDGTLSMARSNDPNSASTQFFICLGRNRSTQGLDGKYTNFGQLIRGYDVLHAIGEVNVGPNKFMGGREVSAPLEEIKIIKAYLSDTEGNRLGE